MKAIIKGQIDELLIRGVDEIINHKHLKKRLLSGEKLRIKLGVDPTSPNIHLGNAVVLLKLRDFQKMGHQVIFIIGDFTGVIGDTSDKISERPMLSEKEVRNNMKTYIAQAAKILDINKTEIHYNSKWLAELGYAEIGKQADQFSITEFISRKNIKERLVAGRRISLRELLYPLMQGYDSVAVKADLEIGGTDQRFNLLAGRTIQTYYKQPAQDILMVDLIFGTDGKKMSKSRNNAINISESPNNMFERIMSLSDDLIISYFLHCTRISVEEIKEYQKQLKNRVVNPRDIKMKLALEITKIYWGKKKALAAQNFFITVFQKKETSVQLPFPKMKLTNKKIIDILILSGLAKSKSEVSRLIKQKGIRIDGKIVKSSEEIVKKDNLIQKGKRHFLKII